MNDADSRSRRRAPPGAVPGVPAPDRQARPRRRRRPGRGVQAEGAARRRGRRHRRRAARPLRHRGGAGHDPPPAVRARRPRRRLVRRRRGAARGEPRRVGCRCRPAPVRQRRRRSAERLGLPRRRRQARGRDPGDLDLGPRAGAGRAAPRGPGPRCCPPTDAWLRVADDERVRWKAAGIPMEARRPELLRALNAIYVGRAHHEGQVEPAAEAALFAERLRSPLVRLRSRTGTTPESAPRRGPRLAGRRGSRRSRAADGAGPHPAGRGRRRPLRRAGLPRRPRARQPRALPVGRQAPRPALGEPGHDQPAAGPRRAAQSAARPAQGRRSLRLRPRRRRGAGPRRRGPPLRGRPRRVVGDRRAGAGRHPGHAPRPGLGRPGRLRPRRVVLRAGGRFAGAEGHDAGRADGRQHAGPDRRPPGRPRLVRTRRRSRSSSPRRRPTRARGSARSATSSPGRRCSCPKAPGTLVVGDVVSLAATLAPASCGGSSSNRCRRPEPAASNE